MACLSEPLSVYSSPHSSRLQTGWTPQARLRDHEEAEAEAKARDAHRAAAASGVLGSGHPGSGPPKPKARRTGLDPLDPDADLPPQVNEGGWNYTLREENEEEGDSGDASPALVLEVPVGRAVDPSACSVDVHPGLVRVLVNGKLLQVHLLEEVSSAAATCQHSRVSGVLTVRMPTASGVLRPKADAQWDGRARDAPSLQPKGKGRGAVKLPPPAAHSLLFEDGGDEAPPVLA